MKETVTAAGLSYRGLRGDGERERRGQPCYFGTSYLDTLGLSLLPRELHFKVRAGIAE